MADIKEEIDAVIKNHITNAHGRSQVRVKGHGSLEELVEMVNLYEQGYIEAAKELILKHEAIDVADISKMTSDMQHPTGKVMLKLIESGAKKTLRDAAAEFGLEVPDVSQLPAVEEHVVSWKKNNNREEEEEEEEQTPKKRTRKTKTSK